MPLCLLFDIISDKIGLERWRNSLRQGERGAIGSAAEPVVMESGNEAPPPKQKTSPGSGRPKEVQGLPFPFYTISILTKILCALAKLCSCRDRRIDY